MNCPLGFRLFHTTKSVADYFTVRAIHNKCMRQREVQAEKPESVSIQELFHWKDYDYVKDSSYIY